MTAPEELDWSKVRFLIIEELVVQVVQDDGTVEFNFLSEKELNDRFFHWASQADSRASIPSQLARAQAW